MELFTVNRYSGDSKAIDHSNEDEILKNLLQKVEKRKRKSKKSIQNLEIQNNELENIENETVVKSPVHKKQKIEILQEDSPEITEQNHEKDPNDNFKVLGEDVFDKKQKIEMVLPPWLSHPTIIANKVSPDDQLIEIEVTNLSYVTAQIKTNLNAMGIEKLFPVQKEVIPWILNVHSKPAPFRPRDICVSAPTGSGKTLAFVIPIIQLLTQRVERKIRALIVLPVNELALQVFKVFKRVAEHTNLSICLLSKSFSFLAEQQQLVECFKGQYYSKTDIVVTTPGRLVDHLHATAGFDLQHLKFLVIDEADRIMDQIHHNWLYHLDEHVRTNSDMFLSGRSAPLCLHELEDGLQRLPHKLLFSATLSQDPEKLQNLRLFQPKLFTSVVSTVEEIRKHFMEQHSTMATEEKLNEPVRGEFIGKYTTPAELTEKYCLTETRLKPLTLYAIIKANKWNKFLCFTNSAKSASRLTFVLDYLFHGGKMKIMELSSVLAQSKRTEILDLFSRGKLNGLICSDALARGIDVPEVDIVISYDCARHIKTHIHRVGRTARAGRPGTAITILSSEETDKFNRMISEGGKQINEELKTDTLLEEQKASHYSEALQKLQLKLENEKKTTIIQKNIVKQLARTKNVRSKPSKQMSRLDQLQAQAETEIVNNLYQFKNDNQPENKKKSKKKNNLK